MIGHGHPTAIRLVAGRTTNTEGSMETRRIIVAPVFGARLRAVV